MNFQEIEELLYTDMEVRQEMEEFQQRPVRTKRLRKRIFAGPEVYERVRVDDRAEVEEEDICPKLASPVPWPLLAQEYTRRESAWPRS